MFNWHDVLSNVVYPGLLTLMASAVVIFVKVANSFIMSKFKELNHFKGDSVVQESIVQAMSEMGDDVHKALADGKLTSDELKTLKTQASAIAENKLRRLYGFYKRDLVGWIDERIDATLPKLISHRVKAFISGHL